MKKRIAYIYIVGLQRVTLNHVLVKILKRDYFLRVWKRLNVPQRVIHRYRNVSIKFCQCGVIFQSKTRKL